MLLVGEGSIARMYGRRCLLCWVALVEFEVGGIRASECSRFLRQLVLVECEVGGIRSAVWYRSKVQLEVFEWECCCASVCELGLGDCTLL